ncbi:MAG: phosphate acyltransferase PlsX [Proteobacteria bacterium]|nr:phosphate acyltransferase PlsX [Pseudomonadota bacterium]
MLLAKKTSTKALTLAVDGMGGDHAPASVLAGMDKAFKANPNLSFLLFGPESELAPLLVKYPKLAKVTTLTATDVVVLATDKPTDALRRKRGSSMHLAAEAVKSGAADAAVSAGNTGAWMAIATLALRTAAGIDRPAIASFMPSPKGPVVMLDMGANIQCDANNLVQFAGLGAAFYRQVTGVQAPTVGVLNIGSEDGKGKPELNDAHATLKTGSLAYHGFVEGNDIMQGTVQVVVTDGFTGNVALKAIEGAAKGIKTFFTDAVKRSVLGWIGMLIAAPVLLGLKKKVDPRLYNGAVFLGLNGVVVKSHGGTDATGFATALAVAATVANDRKVSS